MARRMTLADYTAALTDQVLLDIHEELRTGIVPATGYAHKACRKINKMIDDGEMCINEASYRKVYLPTLAKAVFKEMAARYSNYCRYKK